MYRNIIISSALKGHHCHHRKESMIMHNFFLSNELQLEVNSCSGLTSQIIEHLSQHDIQIESLSAHTFDRVSFIFLVSDDNILASQMLKKLPGIKKVTEKSVIFFPGILYFSYSTNSYNLFLVCILSIMLF